MGAFVTGANLLDPKIMTFETEQKLRWKRPAEAKLKDGRQYWCYFLQSNRTELLTYCKADASWQDKHSIYQTPSFVSPFEKPVIDFGQPICLNCRQTVGMNAYQRPLSP